MKLVIDRAKWLRGCGKHSALLTPDGKMCCLGFFGDACGLPPHAMLVMPSPDAVVGYTERWPSWLLQYLDERGYHRDTRACNDLIAANDSALLPEEERERAIATIFAKHGVEVEFIEDALKAPTDSMSVHDPSTDDRIE